MPCLPSSFFNQLAIAILIREEHYSLTATSDQQSRYCAGAQRWGKEIQRKSTKSN
jgi:hypothetical protein